MVLGPVAGTRVGQGAHPGQCIPPLHREIRCGPGWSQARARANGGRGAQVAGQPQHPAREGEGCRSMTDRIRDALQYLDHDDREVWIMAGMAIKDELGEDGFDIWDTWSQRSDAYEDRAARKAEWILSQCKHERHAYLHQKGWPQMTGSVWWPAQEQNLLCIPMRVGRDLVGVQLIDRRGEKKYLKGQRTSGAEYCISNPGHGALDWWVEGYATGLSLRDCLHALRMRYRIHICFSAGNLKRMATVGVVVADNDVKKTGEAAAHATGLPYFMPPPGDLNDMHKAQGLFRTSQALRKWLSSVQTRQEAAV